MDNTEREINLKRLMYKALKHWRMACVAAVVGAVVVGGTKCTVECVMGKEDAVAIGMKCAMFTGAVVLFVICSFYGLRYIMSGYVQDREEFEDWGVYVAELPTQKQSEKKRFGKIDRLMGQAFLGNVYRDESERRLAVAAKHIEEMARHSFAIRKPRLVLVGEMSEELLTAYASLMNRETIQKGACFRAGGNLLLDHTVIDAIRGADGVVLVAEQGVTRRESVHCIRKMLADVGKQPMAVLLIGADAID